jgi:transcriptional regulator with XRE-family HTH domain
LRSARRAAGLTQAQLGARVGYHHSLISKLESGLREPGPLLVRRIDEELDTRGALLRHLEDHPAPVSLGAPSTLGLAMLSLPPGQESTGPLVDLAPFWPATLPSSGVSCPLHPRGDSSDVCPVPPASEAMQGIADLRRSTTGLPSRVDPRSVHALAGLLAGLAVASTADPDVQLVTVVERVVRLVVRWARATASREDRDALLRLAAGYGQLAGRLRMQRGQRVVAMSWLTYAMSWAEMADDVPSRASLLTDVCTLVRLDDDLPSAIGYARALGAVDPRRPWVMTLAHTYEARAHAWSGDLPQCRHHVLAARRTLARLDERDLVEAPWLGGDHGVVRVESAVGGALRDLAVATGDATLARPAAHATRRSLALLPARMRPTRLLLGVRLADIHACLGDLDGALATATPLLDELSQARRWTIDHEVAGLRRRLARWRRVPAVRSLDERLAAR